MGVEEIAIERVRRRSIKFVAGHGMTDARQVHTDLVRAAGPDANFEECEFVEAPQHLIFGNGRAATRQSRRHAYTANRISCDRSCDLTPIRFHPAVHERDIKFFDFAAGELFGKMSMGLISARDQDHSAGEPIQAMHDTRP
jgi:hypothetical protein